MMQDDLKEQKGKIEKPNYSSLKSIYDFLGWAPSLALVSAFFYFVSYIYFSSFCKRLSLPFRGMDLPLTFFIGDLWLLILLIIILLSLIKILFYYSSYFKAVTESLIFIKLLNYISYSIFIMASAIAVLFILMIILAIIFGPIRIMSIDQFIFLKSLPNIVIFYLSRPFLFILSGVLAALFGAGIEFILKSIRKTPKSKIKNELNTLLTFAISFNIITLIGFVILLLISANFLGDYSAKTLIEGKNDNIEITVIPEDNSTYLPTKNMILVMIHDGNYYLVEKNESAPNNVPTYIIPINKVKVAIANRISKN